LLRDWRANRGMSQLDLALHAGFSARHVSFIETGRTQPSRQAVLILAESLAMPLRDRNRLLEAAGYAHVYRQTSLDADEMRHVRGVLRFILDRHMPYGAVVQDRYSTCIMANDAAAQLVTALVDPSLLADHMNYLHITFHPLGARRWIVNWEDVSRHLLGRAERELGAAADDPIAVAMLDELRGSAGPSRPQRAPIGSGVADVLLPIHIRKDDLELRLFSTVMTLGTPQDVTLQELRIETFFPADEASERTWRKMAAADRVASKASKGPG
jgi:transcriptional regulator with XRE-family HTH domain